MKSSKMLLLTTMILAAVCNVSVAEELISEKAPEIIILQKSLFENIKPAISPIFEQDSLPKNSFGDGIEKNFDTPKHIIIIRDCNIFLEASPSPEVLFAIINQLPGKFRMLDDSKNEENLGDELREKLNK